MAAIPPGKQKVFRLTDVAPQKSYAHPDPALVSAWADAYHTVGQYEVHQIPFYCRPLTRGEYRFCRELAGGNTSAFEEHICQRACLWPEEFDFTDGAMAAAVPSVLCAHVLDLSGFTEESRNRIFHAWQDRVYDQDERHDMLIEIAYPHFSHADLDNMAARDYYHYLARAEFRIRTQLLTSMNPEFSPDELVDLLLVRREDLERRLDEVRDNIQAIMEEQQKITAEQELARRKRMRLGGMQR